MRLSVVEFGRSGPGGVRATNPRPGRRRLFTARPIFVALATDFQTFLCSRARVTQSIAAFFRK